jgi:ribosomal protein S18 acetylase RimI-like enzyme
MGTTDDTERIAEILVDAWIWAYSSFVPPELMAERTNLPNRIRRIRESWNSDNLTLVGVNQRGTVCGFASERKPCELDGYQAEIGALYVDPNYNRTGVGSALVRAMADDFLSRGLKNMAIHTLAQNEIGCRFYAKIGGARDAEDVWNGMPGVWFVWPELEKLLD